MVYEKILDSKWCTDLLKKTDIVIQNAYEINKPIYTFVLEYIRANKLLISNIDLLINQNISSIKYNKPIHIYVLEPTWVGTDLFKQICKKKGKGFALNTEIKDKHYSIEYQTKQLVKISKIYQYNNVSLVDFVLPISVDNLLVFPPILELIDLYKCLYNPEYVGDWVEIIEHSKIIQTMTNNHILETVKHGGRSWHQRPNQQSGQRPNDNADTFVEDCSTKTCKSGRNAQVNVIKELMIEFLSTYTDYVAIHKFNDTHLKGKNIKIISQNDIETDFERLNNFISKMSTDSKSLIFKKKSLFVGKDTRIIKHTFYLTMSKYGNQWSITKKPFLDIYNNTSYELIPYETVSSENVKLSSIKYAHPWVQIRFYYIEIWNIFAAYKMDIFKKEQCEIYISDILDHIVKIKIEYDSNLPKKYTGIYRNEFLSYKQAMLKDGQDPKQFC